MRLNKSWSASGWMLFGSGMLLCLGICATANADPVFGEVFPLHQPDGTTVDVRVWGDEFYRVVESLDGYTLVRDPDTGAGCYARLSPDGNELVSTGVPVGTLLPAMLNLEPHLRIHRASAAAKIEKTLARVAEGDREVLDTALRGDSRQDPPCTGEVHGLVLLVDFSDEPWTIPASNIDDYCNEVGYTGYDNNGSVRDYFYDVSDGDLIYTNFVPTTYYRALHPMTYYDDPDIPYGERARELIIEALTDLDDSGFDFSEYDSNGDGLVDAVNCFYAGTRSPLWAEGLWPHSWTVSFSADGVSTYRYQITDIGTSLRLSTFCHENGHMICYWPDLYDYGYESAGVGRFCLMCSSGSGTNPVEPCAYMKHLAGWADTTLLVSPQSDLTAPAGVNTIYKYDHPTAANEYYLIENRQQTARDTAIPDHGLAIWHVDEYGNNDYEQMTPEYHYECTLVQADGDWDLENDRNSGDSTDLWAAPEYTECTPETYPNTNWWDGSESDLFITDISYSGATMTFTFGTDCNGNGIPDECDLDCDALGGDCNVPDCGLSSDENENGIPDECDACFLSSPAQPELLDLQFDPISQKIRYLSFSAGDEGMSSQAVRVTFSDVPPPYGHWNDTQLWVQEPDVYCENAGAVQQTPCPTQVGDLPDTGFFGATLGCDPYWADWKAYDLVHVWNEGIIPGGTYYVQVIASMCPTGVERNYSTALGLTQSGWADLIKDCSTTPCGPPDGSTGIVDVTAVLDKYKNLAGNVKKVRADIEGSPAGDARVPDQAINITDVTFCLGAFLGETYPPPGFPLPGDPPVCP